MVWNASDIHQEWWRLWLLLLEEPSLLSGRYRVFGSLNRLIYGLAWVKTDAKFAVWFFFNQHVDSQSVGWVTGLIIPSSQSLFSSSLCAGRSACWGMYRYNRGVQRNMHRCPVGFPAPVLNSLAYCRKMFFAVSEDDEHPHRFHMRSPSPPPPSGGDTLKIWTKQRLSRVKLWIQ